MPSMMKSKFSIQAISLPRKFGSLSVCDIWIVKQPNFNDPGFLAEYITAYFHDREHILSNLPTYIPRNNYIT